MVGRQYIHGKDEVFDIRRGQMLASRIREVHVEKLL